MFQHAFSPEKPIKVRVDFKDTVSRTKQEFQRESDINNIMAQYVNYGQIPPAARTGIYGDVSEIGDLLTAERTILQANEAFNSLPANVRDRFKNKPQNMLEFVQDPANREEAISLGLINKPPAPPPAPVVTPPLETTK